MKSIIITGLLSCCAMATQAENINTTKEATVRTVREQPLSQPHVRNVLVELGYSPAEVKAKLDEVFNDVFFGPNKVYFEVGDTMGYVSDIKNHDVRTEGMSYGMMVAVQLNKKEIFDRLWRWAKKYMQHQDGIREGY